MVELFVGRAGPIDRGEEVLLERIAVEVRGQPVLDLGFGGGRTVQLLQELTDDYVGLDYVPELVEAASRRFPQARLEEGDARDLSRFRQGSFALVLFSFNGIDGLAHDDRALVIDEALRVLRPGGVFAYSTHNLDHSAAGDGFLTAVRRRLLHRPWSVVRHLPHLPRALASYARLRRHTQAGDGWTMGPDPAYGFSVVWHYTTLGAALAEARRAGFGQIEVYTSDGRRLPEAASDASTPWFHLLARAPAAAVD